MQETEPSDCTPRDVEDLKGHEEEERYTLTFKGAVYMSLLETPSSLGVTACERVAQHVADRMELAMRRRHAAMVVAGDADPDSSPALILDGGSFVMTAAHKEKTS